MIKVFLQNAVYNIKFLKGITVAMLYSNAITNLIGQFLIKKAKP